MQWRMLQQDKPEDFVIATGHQYSVREFICAAAEVLNMNIVFEGESTNEVGKDDKGRSIIIVDPNYFRPTEVNALLGDASKAQKKLGWEPRISFKQPVSEMVTSDLLSLKLNGPKLIANTMQGAHAKILVMVHWNGRREI